MTQFWGQILSLKDVICMDYMGLMLIFKYITMPIREDMVSKAKINLILLTGRERVQVVYIFATRGQY